MAIFKKKDKKAGVVMASAPEEPESSGESEHITDLDTQEGAKPQVQQTATSQPNVQTIPVAVSQTTINNMIIENNLMLKQLMSMAEEEE